jgi:hypothetical protein
MKDSTDKVVFAIYGFFGSAVGLLIFMFGLEGWSFVFTGRATTRWNGIGALIVCCVIGGGWAFVSYMFKDREAESGNSLFFTNSTNAVLFSKRLMVIATSIVGAYFIWQVAKSM